LNKKLIGLLCITVFSTVLYAQSRDETISLAHIMGVSVPVNGRTPSMVIIENAQFTGTITWSPAVVGTFEKTTEYTATITLTAKKGHTFQGVPANFFIVAGATSVRNNANSGVVTAVFPMTSGAVVNIAAIKGVTAPAAGNTPVTEITETDQYVGSITWSPAVSGTFAAATEYTAIITLTPKRGYGFQGIAANFFTVAGATSVRNSANSGVITAVFPPSVTISMAAITGISAPAAGKLPETKIAENAQYGGTITWSPEVSGTFAENTQYTATITLVPRPGYTPKGVKANFFKVAGATSVSNDADSGVIMAVFTPTKGEKYVFPEDKKYKAIGVSVGSSFAAPLAIVTLHGTIAPFYGAFFDVGVDGGYGILDRDDVEYFSIYPFINLALFAPFAREEGGKRGGWYIGAGVGEMFANYTYKVAGTIWDTTFAVNLVTGFSLFEMIDISYTIRTDFTSADSKLSIGYVYRFKGAATDLKPIRQTKEIPAASVPAASVPAASVPAASVPAASVPAASVPAASVPASSVSASSTPASSTPDSSAPSQQTNDKPAVLQQAGLTLLQQSLNLLPAVPIGGKNLKFEFNGDNWISKINGQNFLSGDCVFEKNGNLYNLTLKTTNVWSGAVEEVIDLFQKIGVPLGPAVGPLRSAAKLAAKTAKWLPLKGSSIGLEYNEDQPASLRLVSR